MKKLILPILALLLLPLIYQSTPTEILKLRVYDTFIKTPEPSGNFVEGSVSSAGDQSFSVTPPEEKNAPLF